MIRNIQTGDFVNQGRDKVNEAFGEIPVGFDIDILTGDFVITKHNDEKIRVPLANFYATLAKASESLLPSAGSVNNAGLLQLGDDSDAEDLSSESLVLPAAGVVRYVESVTENLPDFGTLVEGSIPVVRKKGTKLYLDFISPADMLLAQQALICQMIANCGGGTTPTTPESTFAVVHYAFVDDGITTTPKTPRYVAHADIISCDMVTGWGADWNNLDKPITIDVYIDSVFAASFTCSKPRTDVADHLRKNADASEVSKIDNQNLYGWEWVVPAKYRTGKSIRVTVFAHGSTTEAEVYNSPQTTGVCGTAPVDNTPPPAPYVTQTRLDGPFSLYEGGDELVWFLTDRYNNDSEQLRTSGVDSWEIAEGKPAGLVMTPFENGSKLRMKLTDIDFTKKLTLRAKLSGGGKAEGPIQLVDTTCHRPAGQDFKPQLVYAFALASGGSARPFTTLADACQAMGQHFDGTATALFTPFKAEMANYNIGTPVFQNWSDTDTSCANTDDRIFYVLSGDKSNGQKLAILVQNGKIADVLPSPYTTKPATSITSIAFGFIGIGPTAGSGARDTFYFVKNGVEPTGATGIAPTGGYQNITSNERNGLDDNNEMYAVDSYPAPSHWKALFDQAKAQGYKWFTYANVGYYNERIRFRFRGKASESTYLDLDSIGPADGTNVSLTTVYPT